MNGQININELLKQMEPELIDGEFVFCTVPHHYSFNPLTVQGFFKESEGITLILKREEAENLNLKYTYIAAWITLKVHSSLAAIGFTAAFSNALSSEGISCNVIAAYYHDHIFVPYQDADRALLVLKSLSLQK